MPVETQGLIGRIATALNIAAGPRFFELLTAEMANALGASSATVKAIRADGRERVLAHRGQSAQPVLERVPLGGADGRLLGEIRLQYGESPVPNRIRDDAMRIFAARAAAEIERQQTEEALRESEQRYREFIAHSLEGVWRVEFDPPIPLDLSEDEILDRVLRQGRIAEANDVTREIQGLPTGAELVGRRLMDFPDADARVESVRNLIRGGFRTRTFELHLRDSSGNPKWLEQYQVPIVEGGKLVRGWSISRDITKAKLAADAVREAEERYRSLFEAAGEAILVSRESVVDCNARALLLFRAGREQILGRHPWEFSPELQPGGGSSRELIEQRLEAFLNGIPASFDWQYRRMDGTLFDGHVIVNPVMIGGVRHRLSLIRDISARKKSERQIQELNGELERLVAERTSQLERANRELEAFSYSVSHDVRAAIRGIVACSEIVLSDHGSRLNGTGTRWVESIRDGSLQLDRVTQDLLELSRLARRRPDRTAVDLSALAEMVAKHLSETQPERQARFCIAPGLTAMADESLIRVVLEHLLGNAWKFTRGRETAVIEVGVERTPGGAAFFVADNGVGFDPSKALVLFNAFERLHNSDFEGTGVGLATVRRLVHRHGGRVWAEGSPGQGARIYFTLPEPADG